MNTPSIARGALRSRRSAATSRCPRLHASILLLLFALASAPATGAGVGEWVSLGPATKVTAIAISRFDPSRIAIGSDPGLSLSTDAGESWVPAPIAFASGERVTVRSVVFDPADANVVYAATDLGLVRSTNGGALYYFSALPYATYCLAVRPTWPTAVYVGTSHGLFKSTDRGATWSEVFSEAGLSVQAIAVEPSAPNVIVLMTSGGGMRISTDGGATWAARPALPWSWTDSIAIHPTDPSIMVAMTGNGVYRTTDGAATWSKVASVHGSGFGGEVVADVMAPGRFYAAGHGGIIFSVDDGEGWGPLGYGLQETSLYTAAIHPTDHTRVYVGASLRGVFTTSVGPTDGPSLRVTSPNGGESWMAGWRHPITWATRGSIANVKIEYSTTAPVDGALVDPVTIVERTPNTGSFPWVVPQLNGFLFVRVSDADGTASDMSDGGFWIRMCGFTTLDPPASPLIGAEGGRGTIAVSTEAQCGWSARSDDPWIHVSPGGDEDGRPGTVSYSVAPNLGSSPRTGRLCVGSASFVVYQAAGDETTEGVVFIPIVLDAFGVGSSHYTSELTLTNRSSRDATVRLTYTGASSLGGGSGSTTVTLPAGRQLIEPDALGYLRRLGVPIPASGNRGGTLAVGVRGVTSMSEFAATVRTTTAVPNGRAGLAYSGVPVFKALTEPVYIPGLRENETDRSNLALQNVGDISDGSVTLRVTVFWGEFNGRRVEEDVVLPPGGFAQLNGVVRGYRNAFAKVERVGGTAPWYAYGVVNDAATSDGSFIPPVVASDVGVRQLIVPVVMETGVYATELVVTNASSWFTLQRLDLALEFVSDQVDTPNHTAWARLQVGEGRQVILPNVIQYFRDQGATGIGPAGNGLVGALFVTEYGGMNPFSNAAIGARTWSSGDGGRYGLFYPATPADGASVDSAWLYGLQQNESNRTNLAILNTGEAGDDDDVFAVDVYDGATGRLVHTESGLTVQARRRVQVDAVLSKWAPGVADGYVRIRRTSGPNPFIAYAVINDGGFPQQRSDDGAFIASSD